MMCDLDKNNVVVPKNIYLKCKHFPLIIIYKQRSKNTHCMENKGKGLCEWKSSHQPMNLVNIRTKKEKHAQ